MKEYVFGIDIGGTTVKIGLFNRQGDLLKKWEIVTRKEEKGSFILPDVADALQKEMKERGLRREDLLGIGIGVPGSVLDDSTVNQCPNLGWELVNVADLMKELTGTAKIKVGNDANVAALGEMWKGGAAGHKNVVMVTLGTGVGGGIILDGRIIAGAFGSGGEIGHLPMSKTEIRTCGCGKKGHLEQYASATGIVRKAEDLLRESNRPSLLRDCPDLTAKDVLDAAKAGDGLTLDVLDFVGDMLGRALAIISCTIDPEMYIIGGGVSRAGKILLDTIRSHFCHYAFHTSEGAKFALASLGNDAGIFGAARMVLND